MERVHARWPHLRLKTEVPAPGRRIDTGELDDAPVRAWLVSLPVSVDQTVIVSWDNNLAVTAPFAIVAKYWSDFFYPSGDDAVVTPPTLEWLLVWDHEESFEFGLAHDA